MEEIPDQEQGQAPDALEILALVSGGRLTVNWIHDRRRSDIETLAERFLDHLKQLIAHCLSPEAGGDTPSDFPLAGLDDDKLGRLAAMLDSSESEG